MLEWLDNNDILMCSTHSEGKSVIAEKFIKILKARISEKMTVNDSKSYLSYLNKLVHQYNNAYHHSINKKPINADYSALTEKIETNPKAPKFKVNDRVRITKYKNIFSKGYTENWSREIFIIDSVLETNPWTYKLKDTNREKIIGSFYEKALLQSILLMNYYLEPDSQIRDKVKVVFSPLNLRRHSANVVRVSSRFFLMMTKFCRRNNFHITLVKVIVTPKNIFTLFEELSRRHSCSLVT